MTQALYAHMNNKKEKRKKKALTSDKHFKQNSSILNQRIKNKLLLYIAITNRLRKKSG
jgi:hypothetical protein